MNTNERGASIFEFLLVLLILAILAYGIWAILSGNGISLTGAIPCDPATNIFHCGG